MGRILDGVKVGDWLRILVSGEQRYEQVDKASGLIVQTKSYRFTRYGRIWLQLKLSILADPASKANAERWLEKK